MSNTIAKKPQSPTYLKDLILLFAIPAAIAVFAAAVIYVPRLLAKPKYDFIYSNCSSYDCWDGYFVDAGQVAKKDINPPYPNYNNRYTSLRYYDAQTDSTRTLTLEEARKYRLSTSSKSPDGYTLTREETSSGFLFWGDYDQGWYLKNGAKKKRVELSTDGSYYSRDINFLGWIEK